MTIEPAASEYSSPSLVCDLVMKGGITSGVVYPSAVCEIAKTYRFKNIGGTSAGAIAAATSAAAEYRRAAGGPGFEEFAKLPGWLAEGTHLQDLFQPSSATWPLFQIAMSFLGGGWPPWKLVRALFIAGAVYWPATAAAALIDVFLVGGVRFTGGGGWWTWMIVGISCILVVILAIAYFAWNTVRYAMTENGFGLCSGMDRLRGKEKPLTDWLTDEIDKIAGIPLGTVSLTFGDLWTPPAPGTARIVAAPFKPVEFAALPISRDQTDDQLPGPEERVINLRMITTCLTFGHPYSLPFTSREFFFDPEYIKTIFPAHICTWLVNNSPQPTTRAEAIKFALLRPKLPLPPPDRIPLVLAARLSLIFPILLSAVRFAVVDWTCRDNQEAKKRVDEIIRTRGDDALTYVQQLTPEERQRMGIVVQAEPCWFSDGGISSNFPVQFFDAPIPRWPTFAIDLDNLLENEKPDDDENKNVWMPESNYSGASNVWNRFGSDSPRKSLIGYLSTILDTSRNWVDNTQARTAGYRDRVVHVVLAQDEGGLNLRMKTKVVNRLAARGKAAGALLVSHYATPTPKVVTNWVNHRWVRYRSYIAMLENVMQAFWRGYHAPTNAGVPTYQAMITSGRTNPPPSYHFRGNQQQWAVRLTGTVDAAGTSANAEVGVGNSLADGAPRPLPELLVKPRM